MNFSRGMDRVATVAAVAGGTLVLAVAFDVLDLKELKRAPTILEFVGFLVWVSLGAAVPYGLVQVIKWVIVGFKE